VVKVVSRGRLVVVLLPRSPIRRQTTVYLRRALGERALLPEHVGSTSVHGLAAKPVIDILLAVADSADEASYVPPLEAQGFILRIREPDWHQHRLLKTPYAEGSLHVFSMGCEEIDRMLTSRDRLRTHEDDRRLYEERKKLLAARTWKHMQDHAEVKTEVVISRVVIGDYRQPVGTLVAV